MDTPKKLYRSRTDKMIAGVCGGLGEYFNMDSLIFRIIFVALLFAGGSGFWIYLVLAIIIPAEPLAGQPFADVEIKDRVREFAGEVRASAQNFAQQVKKEDTHNHLGDRRHWIGLIIVIVGAIALVDQLFPQYWINWGVLWPVAIIVVGIAILSRRGHNR